MPRYLKMRSLASPTALKRRSARDRVSFFFCRFIARVLVGVVLHGHAPVSPAHLVIAGVRAHPQHTIGREHRGRHIARSGAPTGLLPVEGVPPAIEARLGTLEKALCQPAEQQPRESPHGGAREEKSRDGKRPLEAAKSQAAAQPATGQYEDEPSESDKHIHIFLYDTPSPCRHTGVRTHAMPFPVDVWQRYEVFCAAQGAGVLFFPNPRTQCCGHRPGQEREPACGGTGHTCPDTPVRGGAGNCWQSAPVPGREAPASRPRRVDTACYRRCNVLVFEQEKRVK